MRLFYLYRIEDESKVSGTGFVAEGVIFDDGSCTLRWRTDNTSTAVYRDLPTLKAIHEHGGKSVVLYEDMDLVHDSGQPVIFDGTICHKPLPDGKTEQFDGWPGKHYCRISEWIGRQELVAKYPRLAMLGNGNLERDTTPTTEEPSR